MENAPKIISTEKILKNLSVRELNPMQTATAAALEKFDSIKLLSDTGSGKTLAFLLPLLNFLDPKNAFTQALIMVPSRELALQIESVLKKIQSGYKVTVCYGGHKREIEENNLIQPPAIIIATAGRMADHIKRGNVKTDQIRFLVLDEFDKMLELGFLEEMEFILQSLPSVNKQLLTSATESTEIPVFIKWENAHTLNFLTGIPKDDVRLSIQKIIAKEKDKLTTLLNLICFLKNTTTIVFCNHRDAVERVSQYLAEQGVLNVFYHGGMEQHQREVALCKFRNSSADILITTDLASRGLDISNVRSVVHYHLPTTEEAFIHRNGRTARMEATGNVYLIIGPDEETPKYVAETARDFELPQNLSIPDKPKWSTLFIDAGKKDKINKIDIVGFLSNKGKLKKDEIGLIEVKDFSAFAAVRKSKIGLALENIKNEKIKNKKVKIAIAK